MENDPHKFLGSHLSFSGKQEDTFDYVKDHLCTRLERIDKLLVRGEYKVKIYKNYLLPSCRFILTVQNVTKTNLLALDSTVHRNVKSWSELARSEALEVIHIPYLLDIKSIYQDEKRTPGLILIPTPAFRGRINGQKSFLFLHIVNHLRKRKLWWPDPLKMRLLRAGWTILKTWLFKVICSALLFWENKNDDLWKSFMYDFLKGS